MKELTINEGETELGVTTVDGEQAIVSSRDISKVFGKRHKHVLRDIDNIIDKASENFTETNFGRSHYKDKSGKKNREYLMTKDGFVMVVMGYTGEKAMKFKEAYINQFNRMEKLIKNRYLAKSKYKPMTDAIKEFRQNQGKTPKFCHFSNEANMLNRIVLGCSAKKYCETNNISRNKLRDYLSDWQLKALHKLEKLNTDLLHMGIEYQQRKEMLSKKYDYLFRNGELLQEGA